MTVLNKVLKSAEVFPAAGEPEDIANLILFLASDESKFVNGATIVSDGGWTIQ
jgi:NAD(P)-dependent dehydrogenase (short-subunit alcohol dehydrogenase family)